MAPIRLPLVFGAGIDRGSGLLSVASERPRDARNVHLSPGRSEMRRGLARTLSLSSADAILAMQPIESTGQVACVVLNGQTADLLLCNVLANGALEVINQWQTIMTFDQAVGRAPIIVTESGYDRVLIAHAEPIRSKRNDTLIFDATTLAAPIPVLALPEGDDPLAPANGFAVPFRGVRSHMEFMLAWGYGVPDIDEASGEILRISLPGLPDRFRELHYITIGRRGTPIIDVQSLDSGAVVFKTSETYWLSGSGRASWGHRRIDPKFGLLADRLAITVGGVCYFWSLEGPRRITGPAPSQDLAFPLNLRQRFRDAPEFEDRRQGFALYTPFRNEVEWIFGRFGYVLNLNSEEWTTNEYASEPLGCGAVVPVNARADENGRAPTFPRPIIASAACAQGGEIRPIIVGAACETVVNAEVRLIRSVPQAERAVVRVNMRDPVLMEDCGLVSGDPVYQLNWNGGVIESIDLETPAGPVRVPVPATTPQIRLTSLPGDSAGEPRIQENPLDQVLGAFAGGSHDTNVIPFNAGNDLVQRLVKMCLLIQDYGLLYLEFLASPSIQKLRDTSDTTLYQETRQFLPTVATHAPGLEPMQFSKGLAFTVLPTIAGCSAFIRYRLTSVGGAYTSSAPVAVDVLGTRVSVATSTYNQDRNTFPATIPPDDNPNVQDAAFEVAFPEYDYEVVLTHPEEVDKVVASGTARSMWAGVEVNLPAFDPDGL